MLLPQNSLSINLFFRHSLVITSAAFALVACGGGGGNTPPQVTQQSLSVSLLEDQSVSGAIQATDADGDRLGYAVGSTPEHGSIQVQQNGDFTYTPNPDFFGDDVATITVSDSIEAVNVSLQFSVVNVNDLPVIGTASVAVSSNGQTNGIVEASDVDGDALSFSVVTQAQQGFVDINSNTGEFVFTADALENIDDSFVVSVTDNVGEPVTATISLGASYVSNLDKLNYYYASSHSHIGQAEALIVSDSADDQFAINDAELALDAYVEIAVGYANAGFADLSKATITEKIITRQARADAYRRSANGLAVAGSTEQAAEFRRAAIAEYNAYLAEVGIENVSSSDAEFYVDMNNDYLEAGDLESALALISVTQVYADSLVNLEEPSSTAHRRFDRAARSFLTERTEQFLTNPTEINFNGAVAALDYATHIADSISFNLQRGNPLFRFKAFALIEVTRLAYLMTLQGTEDQRALMTHRAKTLLAKSISLFTSANYDSDYSLPIADYASETLRRYPTGASFLAGPFAGLYPEYVRENSDNGFLGNIPLEIVIGEEGPNDSDAKLAYRDHFAYSFLHEVTASGSVSETITALSETFTTQYDDTRLVTEALVEQDNVQLFNKRAAWILYYAGYSEQARELVQHAIDTLSTPAYIDDVGTNVDDLVENTGCLRYSQLYVEFGGATSVQFEQMLQCLNLIETYFGEDSTATTARQMTAWMTAAKIQHTLGNTEGSLQALASAQQIADANEDFDDQLSDSIEVASALASLGYLEEAAQSIDSVSQQALAHISAAETLEDRIDIMDEIFGELERVLEPDDINAFLGIDNTLLSTRKWAGIAPTYATSIASMNAAITDLLEGLFEATSDLSDNDKVDAFEELVQLYAWLGNTEAAKSLAINEVFFVADSEALLSDIAQTIAVKDDLPNTPFANVDTDSDGMPNFFIMGASAEDILNSALTLDNDADNDGIEDPNDLSPLDKN